MKAKTIQDLYQQIKLPGVGWEDLVGHDVTICHDDDKKGQTSPCRRLMDEFDIEPNGQYRVCKIVEDEDGKRVCAAYKKKVRVFRCVMQWYFNRGGKK